MLTRRDFLHRGLAAAGALSVPLIGASSARAASPATDIAPPPDLFDAQALDIDFWLRPRTLSVTRPASGERAIRRVTIDVLAGTRRLGGMDTVLATPAANVSLSSSIALVAVNAVLAQINDSHPAAKRTLLRSSANGRSPLWIGSVVTTAVAALDQTRRTAAKR